MLNIKRIYFIIFIVLCGIILLNTVSNAQTVSSKRKLQITVGGGYGLFSMDKINKRYIDDFAKGFDILDEHINNGYDVSGDIGYFIRPNISGHLGITYLSGGINNKTTLMQTDELGSLIGTFPYEYSLKTTSFAPELKIKYHFFLNNNFDLFFGGGMALCFGKSILKGEGESSSIGEKHTFTARGIGYFAISGLKIEINKIYSIGFETGYRHFTTGELKNNDGEVWSQEMNLNLDFSGLFLLGTLSITFSDH